MKGLIMFLSTLAVLAMAQAGAQEIEAMQPAVESTRSSRGPMHAMGAGMHSMVRHQYVMREGLPADYERLTNPLRPDAQTLANGKRIYTQSCAACHGDGPAAAALNPGPSNIGRLPRMPFFSSDAYLYWTVAEGGVPIGTAMPAFKGALSAEDIWSVIHYLREGL
jgi:mono/diheme cytochrome c family protein